MPARAAVVALLRNRIPRVRETRRLPGDGRARSSSRKNRNPTAQAAITASLRSSVFKVPNQSQIAGPAPDSPRATSNPAQAASMPSRISVDQPTGFGLNWPKHRQSGLRPRTIAAPSTMRNAASSASAPQAPYHATADGTSETPTPSSSTGTTRTAAGANAGGRPKSRHAFRHPIGSASLVAPARRNTKASRRRSASRANSAILNTSAPVLSAATAFRMISPPFAAACATRTARLRSDPAAPREWRAAARRSIRRFRASRSRLPPRRSTSLAARRPCRWCRGKAGPAAAGCR